LNKAHAASYGWLAYLSAYMTVHRPLEFSCALLNHHQGMHPLRTLAVELTSLGVKLLPPHLNFSDYYSALVEHGERLKKQYRSGWTG
jgi:DNA polymerase III alpha subunit